MKAVSVCNAIKRLVGLGVHALIYGRLNSTIECRPYCFRLTSDIAMELVSQYDIILDCTDNPASRYLVNDAAVLCGKPLVSGSALRSEGQLTTYNHEGGPCYRCLFPTPPPPSTVTNCSDGGVLGVVPGLLGILQATEAMKIALGLGSSFRQKLLLVDALEGQFRSVKLRDRRLDCDICGAHPSITELQDYEALCGCKMSDTAQSVSLLAADLRVRSSDLLPSDTIIDVRPPVQYGICSIPDSINLPLKELLKPHGLTNCLAECRPTLNLSSATSRIVFVCRRGNDSQRAVAHMQGQAGFETVDFKDLVGGLVAWAVDKPEFPEY